MKRSLISPAPTDLPSLAHAIGERLHTGAVFGAPVTQRRTTVIPVARARFGLGGGGRAGGHGGRAGGGMSISPAGFIVLDKGRARWRPIRSGHWRSLLLMGLMAGAAAFAASRRPTPLGGG